MIRLVNFLLIILIWMRGDVCSIGPEDSMEEIPLAPSLPKRHPEMRSSFESIDATYRPLAGREDGPQTPAASHKRIHDCTNIDIAKEDCTLCKTRHYLICDQVVGLTVWSLNAYATLSMFCQVFRSIHLASPVTSLSFRGTRSTSPKQIAN